MKSLFKKISLSSDHAGFSLKEKIRKYLLKKKIKVLDLGPQDNNSVDYPDYAKKVARNVISKKSNVGILVCGSGTGMAISANKFKKIRAAVCYNIASTRLSRMHNNANILALGSRLTKKQNVVKLVNLFLSTKFIRIIMFCLVTRIYFSAITRALSVDTKVFLAYCSVSHITIRCVRLLTYTM